MSKEQSATLGEVNILLAKLDLHAEIEFGNDRDALLYKATVDDCAAAAFWIRKLLSAPSETPRKRESVNNIFNIAPLVERVRKWAKHQPYGDCPELIDAAIEAADCLEMQDELIERPRDSDHGTESAGCIECSLSGRAACPEHGVSVPSAIEQRPCTCDPADYPPVPCAKKYALAQCREATKGSAKPFVHGSLNCNHSWTGKGEAPASWWCCGVKVYRSYEDYCDD